MTEEFTYGRTQKRGVVRKTNRLGLMTIEVIKQAAKTVLVRDGATRFTVDRVAQEAGVTKGTLLYHFKTKDQLLYFLVDDYVTHLQERLDAGIERARSSFRYRDESDELVAGFIEWYRAFRTERSGYTAFGLSLLALVATDSKARKQILDWYQKLFSRLRASSCKDAVWIVLTLEGLFFLKHFQLDVTLDDEINDLLTRLEKKL